MFASEFVTAVRRQGAIPSTYASTDILAVGDGEVQGVFIPLLEQLRQNYFVREITSTVDVRGRVSLPSRAIGAALRSVQLAINNTWTSLPNRAMEDADGLSSGQAFGYYLDGGSICLLPTGATGTLRIRYAARPGKMCLESDATLCKAITSVTPGATTTTIACGSYVGSTTIDIISSGPAHQHKAISTTLTTSAIVPTADLIEGLVAMAVGVFGDYVVYPDRSPFVPLPEELAGALVHRTAGVILRGYGYDEEAAQQLKLAEEAVERMTPMLSPRNEGNPQRIKGGLRRALGGRGRWF